MLVSTTRGLRPVSAARLSLGPQMLQHVCRHQKHALSHVLLPQRQQPQTTPPRSRGWNVLWELMDSDGKVSSRSDIESISF